MSDMNEKELIRRETDYMLEKINYEREKEFHKWEHYFRNVDNIPDECNLFAEFYPYYYMSVPRKGEFMIFFKSNCLKGKKIFFEIEFNEN